MYKNSHVLKVAVLTCLEIMLSITGNAHAENSKETGTKMLSDEDFLGKMPVILSASRLSQPPAEAPAAMKRLGLRLARPFRGGEIAVVAQNVLNGYQEYRYQNIFDSRWYATLTLDLQ